MDTKLFLCALLYSLFSVVNSLAIEYGNVDINTIDSNVKYSKKISYSTKNKGMSNIIKWILIAVIIIVIIAIVVCICCCLGCCARSGTKKQKKREIHITSPEVTPIPYGSSDNYYKEPTQPSPAYNPGYP
ncbi:hypothetical protein H8356DRAFT_1660514 [Neocallimastix lanati (nom. inval.)]|jgi:hypothetical protein|uniref:Mid2 domain-containing protein n=1 Tax=Neocallimastix californiae TaxID=1754190 RepID=A0A1Y2DCQ5_9FUNG|nr:hypothetical protein H8356DRAFT_1660514 [Neocallimastix sp. JGI-2020a]ORY57063.1 hypothetical protein LY90DRAFT_669258 [Neocallimastix californiae]|eukprot:ORY57063.1 hypothetical protein LY90DRAFT_669258 [Neocallimastix californiae]